MKKIFFFLFIASSLQTFADTTGYYVWVQKAEFPPLARHRAIGFSIGDKGYMGLGHVNAGGVNIAYPDFWEFDKTTNSWAQKADFGGGTRFGAVGFSIGNKGYAGTGTSAAYVDYNDLWEYNPVLNTWTQKAPMPGVARDGATGFSINGKGYLGLGYYSDWYEYDPLTNVWLTKANYPSAVPFYSASFVIDTVGYVCTGEYTYPSQLMSFHPSINSWIPQSPFPGLARFGATGFSCNGKGFIGLGCDYGYSDFKDFYEYNPQTNIWDTLTEFPGSRRHYVPGFNIGNKGYCGTGTNGTNLKDFWEFYYYIPFIDTTGIETTDELAASNAIEIFPNPISNSANFRIKVSPVDFALFTVSGTKVYEEKNIQNNYLFDRKNLLSGIYFFSVSVHGNKIQTGKIILL